MDYIVTLGNVDKADRDSVGQRALDLARLSRKHIDTPLGFVITAEALEKYVAHNDIEEIGAEFLADEDYDSLQQVAMRGDIPRDVRKNIEEAYQTLSVDEEGSASQIVGEEEDAYVTLIPSPNYNLGDNGFGGIFQNVKGLDELLDAVKMSWSSLFTRDAFKHRENQNISEFYSGLIIQKMPDSDTSAEAKALRDSNKISVETWFGFPEYGMGLEKDYFEVSKDLKLEESQIAHQVQQVGRNENGDMERRSIGDRGENQKIDDKTVVELARLAKKSSNVLENDVRTYYTLENGEVYLILVDRIINVEEEKERVEERPETHPGIESEQSKEEGGEEPPEYKPESFEEDVEQASEETDMIKDEIEEFSQKADSISEELSKEAEQPPEFSRESGEEGVEHLQDLKAKVNELDELVKKGDSRSVRQKLNELDQAIKKLREHH